MAPQRYGVDKGSSKHPSDTSTVLEGAPRQDGIPWPGGTLPFLYLSSSFQEWGTEGSALREASYSLSIKHLPETLTPSQQRCLGTTWVPRSNGQSGDTVTTVLLPHLSNCAMLRCILSPGTKQLPGQKVTHTCIVNQISVRS